MPWVVRMAVRTGFGCPAIIAPICLPPVIFGQPWTTKITQRTILKSEAWNERWSPEEGDPRGQPPALRKTRSKSGT